MNNVTSHRARVTRAPQLALSLLAATAPAVAQQDPAVAYPKTTRGAVADVYHGTRVADPYRWLEGDPRRDPAVAAWVRAQDGVARSYLATLPGRDAFRRRLRVLYDHARVTAPQRHGGRYFFLRHAAGAGQPALVVREGPDGPDRVLADPNAWSKDGTRALAEWAASDDGARVALAVQDSGTDVRTIRVLDVATGRYLADEVARVRFTTVEWMKDGSGFFYSRFPDPTAGSPPRPGRSGHAVYFHMVGTPQRADRLVYATPAQPHVANVADVTEDGRYLVVYSTTAGGGNALAVVDLAARAWAPRPLITALDAGWSVIGNDGTRFFLTTEQGAPRGKIVTLDLADATPTARDVVAEQRAVLHSASLLGGRLVVSYLVDANTEVRRYRLDGAPDGVVALPGVGSVGEFRGRATDDEAFFVFSSPNAPPTVYRYAVARNATRVWSAPRVAADFARIVVEQRFYASKDGTRVPMFVVRRRDVRGPAPTILYAYGGYGISVLPTYSPAQVAWVEQGGVFAVANVRGGLEYGKAWYDAGRGRHKQNTFDDVIAAAEYLKAQGIAAPDGLAVRGESNGGLLVGAVINQRPDLFAAALPGVGVLDMLRFAHLAGGRLGYADYGDPADAGDFRALLAYSPLHNVRPGRAYPAILVTTADADDRVPPAHSFKYVAALQAADLGARPRLLRVERRAGHGDGRPIDKLIEELADQWAFAARWTGLNVTDRP